VLSEFRSRLVAGAAEDLLPDALWLEHVAETLRAVLNAVAVVAPAWVQEHTPRAWYECYGRRIEEYRLPKGKEVRQEYAAQVGADGLHVLTAIYEPSAPAALRQLPAVEILRHTWIQQYVVIEGQVRLRDPKEMLTASEQLEFPYDPDVRYASKRAQHWVSYKVHLAETCDDDLPHLVTQAETTIAPATDLEQLAVIQADLARGGYLTSEPLVDASYVRRCILAMSLTDHQIDLVGRSMQTDIRKPRRRRGSMLRISRPIGTRRSSHAP
jgi:transposase